MGNKISKKILEYIFSINIKNRKRDETPQIFPDSYSISVNSFDNIKLKGWVSKKSKNQNGTIIFCHGFTSNCLDQHIINMASYFSKEFNLLILSFDFRFHGLSGNGIPSFGTAEAKDIINIINYVSLNNFPKPYILVV